MAFSKNSFLLLGLAFFVVLLISSHEASASRELADTTQTKESGYHYHYGHDGHDHYGHDHGHDHYHYGHDHYGHDHYGHNHGHEGSHPGHGGKN